MSLSVIVNDIGECSRCFGSGSLCVLNILIIMLCGNCLVLMVMIYLVLSSFFNWCVCVSGWLLCIMIVNLVDSSGNCVKLWLSVGIWCIVVMLSVLLCNCVSVLGIVIFFRCRLMFGIDWWNVVIVCGSVVSVIDGIVLIVMWFDILFFICLMVLIVWWMLLSNCLVCGSSVLL